MIPSLGARRSESCEQTNIPPPPGEGMPSDPREYINTAQVPRRHFAEVHRITEEEIRDALRKEVSIITLLWHTGMLYGETTEVLGMTKHVEL